MRIGLLSTALLAIALQGCGSGSTTDGNQVAATPAATAKTAKPGRAPVVILATTAATARAETQELSKLGLLAVPVGTDVTTASLKATIAGLKTRADADPNRVGVIAEGPATTAAARLARSTPTLGGVVLANPGADVATPLGSVRTIRVLLQRSADTKTTTDAVARRLLASGPYGMLLHAFPNLGPAAQRDRDAWIATSLR